VASLFLYGFIALIAVGALFGLAVVLLPPGEQIAPPAPDVKPWAIADHSLTSQDVVDVRLPVALRGYRFAETDALLDRLTEEIRMRDEELAELRGETPVHQPSSDKPSSEQPSYEQPAAYVPPPAYDPPAPYSPPPAYQPDYDPSAVREQ
jgi:DivIVA domain-containing protein